MNGQDKGMMHRLTMKQSAQMGPEHHPLELGTSTLPDMRILH